MSIETITTVSERHYWKVQSRNQPTLDLQTLGFKHAEVSYRASQPALLLKLYLVRLSAPDTKFVPH